MLNLTPWVLNCFLVVHLSQYYVVNYQKTYNLQATVPVCRRFTHTALSDRRGRRLGSSLSAPEIKDRLVLTAFTRPAITPPKVNRFGWNLEYCEQNVGGWPWQTFGVIRAVATVWEGAETGMNIPLRSYKIYNFTLKINCVFNCGNVICSCIILYCRV